jgi:hypothetical protein
MAEVREIQEHFPAKSAPLYHSPASSGNAWIGLFSTRHRGNNGRMEGTMG